MDTNEQEELKELRVFKERVLLGIGEAIAQIPPGRDGERATRLLLDYVPEIRAKLKEMGTDL